MAAGRVSFIFDSEADPLLTLIRPAFTSCYLSSIVIFIMVYINNIMKSLCVVDISALTYIKLKLKWGHYIYLYWSYCDIDIGFLT